MGMPRTAIINTDVDIKLRDKIKRVANLFIDTFKERVDAAKLNPAQFSFAKPANYYFALDIQNLHMVCSSENAGAIPEIIFTDLSKHKKAFNVSEIVKSFQSQRGFKDYASYTFPANLLEKDEENLKAEIEKLAEKQLKLELRQQEKDFWETLKRWHLDDIDICLVNNANYAAARTMLSFIDILGGFYTGLIEHKGDYCVRTGGKRKNKDRKLIKINGVNYERSYTKKCFLNFVKNYLHEFYEIQITYKGKRIRAANVLYDHFRNGLIHEGRPKFGSGIFRDNSGEVLRLNYRDLPIALNILALRDLIRRAVFKYEKDLENPKKKYRLLRWRDRYKFLTERS